MSAGECGVCLSGYDGECPAEYYVAKMVKARKPHECVECNDVIPPGVEYERVSAKWEGRPTTIHTCEDCRAIREALACDGFIHHSLWEDIYEVLEELDMACILKVATISGRKKLLRFWEERYLNA